MSALDTEWLCEYSDKFFIDFISCSESCLDAKALFRKIINALLILSTTFPAGNLGIVVDLGDCIALNLYGINPAASNLSLSLIRHDGPKIGNNVL